MPRVDLYYSASLLGHFTLIIYDRIDLIAFRVHFVDRDAIDARQRGKWAWAKHKLAQMTGYAKGRVLMDWVASPTAFRERVAYQTPARPLLRSWAISVEAMDAMLNWTNNLVVAQGQGDFVNYGYIVYSDNVDNCGS